MKRRLLSVPEAAAYIGHSPGTLRNQISRGELPFRYIKSGRKVLIDQRELDEWIERLPRLGGEPGQGR
jgi:excisionase family DNA binding protein